MKNATRTATALVVAALLSVGAVAPAQAAYTPTPTWFVCKIWPVFC